MDNTKSKYTDIETNVKSLTRKSFSSITKETETTINFIYQEKEEILLDLIMERILHNEQEPDILDGFIFQKLFRTDTRVIKNELKNYFPNGVARLQSSLKVDYQPLQNLLINQKFLEADQLTTKFLCQLVEIETDKKKEWLYFTDIQFIPLEDLFAIDLLWRIYSKGNFGFSIQKQIWLSNNKQWEKVWEKIHWKYNGKLRRYPHEFEWTLEAPRGHLPLFNQLRGTKTLLYLFNSITWK